jgi:hypothetical protein
MSYWSVYVSRADEKLLKKKIEQVAQKNHWSFSQTVLIILREHLIGKDRAGDDEGDWQRLAAHSFFAEDSLQDSVYDKL